MGKSLFQKVWDAHTVRVLPNGQTQLFIGMHLIHEVTSPQAFAMLRELNIKVAFPERTFATVDHIIPTDAAERQRPLADPMAEEMFQAIERNTRENGITFFNPETERQGVVHIVGPEQGVTQPGSTIACGDSHTATHGAFGAIAFGIGTSQVRDVLATQTMSIAPFKVRKVEITGKLKPGVYAKDVILYIISKLGVNGGIGYAYEFCGDVIKNMSMESRMTVCNMAIEGGARVGYINPDEVTYEYLKGKPYAPKDWDKAVAYWESIKSDADAVYDDVVTFAGEAIEPMVTWGITPEQAIGISESIPAVSNEVMAEALEYTGFAAGDKMDGKKVDVVFIGSCTNGRIEDFREAAKYAQGRKVAEGVRAMAVPGSYNVKKQAEAEGLDKIFIEAGFEWREPGCSMCLAMNPDKLVGRQISASTSNRNFKGRQGSATGRTLLVSPVMAVAAAVTGTITDARKVFGIGG
ncbi:3-isopropylmalate dehydratase large subunit [Seleniivibrio woodruffii]|uniref:3-isopropylmalate dehydratase large subunit n=1 Tax=Seleniivibrio woodruffii TaxID=1078050 RepID=A0A4R1KB90_9BACT|nr:3-isopropylmalate dehydratase large subunit [Seleniivibrio woodruffii]TCK61704.1 3-isopropylmalate dehydratase large subunit [Seleniivibrio woodruffii]TVZ35181.1 3-isopropylmalate dehydratase, large subunit [Seleniivibrio woodruffii]